MSGKQGFHIPFQQWLQHDKGNKQGDYMGTYLHCSELYPLELRLRKKRKTSSCRVSRVALSRCWLCTAPFPKARPALCFHSRAYPDALQVSTNHRHLHQFSTKLLPAAAMGVLSLSICRQQGVCKSGREILLSPPHSRPVVELALNVEAGTIPDSTSLHFSSLYNPEQKFIAFMKCQLLRCFPVRKALAVRPGWSATCCHSASSPLCIPSGTWDHQESVRWLGFYPLLVGKHQEK